MSELSTAPEFAFPEVFDAVADAIPDRDLVIFGDRRFTQREIADRSRRLATYLRSRGLGVHTDRADLTGDQVGQDLVGFYTYNGNEYVESMHAAFRARVAPFNVNYRYVKSELEYLLNDAAPTALIYHAAFAPTLADVLSRVPSLKVLIQIADDSGNALLDGAVDCGGRTTSSWVPAAAGTCTPARRSPRSRRSPNAPAAAEHSRCSWCRR